MDSRDNTDRTPVHLAAQLDALLDVTQILLDSGSRVDARGASNQTALHVGCYMQAGHSRLAKLLLDNRSDPNTLDANNKAALHLAVEQQRRGIVKLLLQSACDPNI